MDNDFGKLLVRLARCIIAKRLGKDCSYPDITDFSEQLKKKQGVFVTLEKNGALRGCIGIPEPIMSISEALKEAATSAAFSDPRFMPLEAGELNDIDIEVTLLSKPKEIERPFKDKIKIGRDGIILRCGARSGLFLPQVPVEQGWDIDEYLNNICLKAGLSPGCIDDPDARLYTFYGTIYKESELRN